jgi:hypothetical protein
MANRENYPASLFPLRGDLSAEAGATAVTVVGIQTEPVSATLAVEGQTLVSVLGVWTPTTIGGSCISINGLPRSDDYDIGVNLTLGTTKTPVLVNGA